MLHHPLKYFHLILLLLGINFSLCANVEAYFDYKTFYDPGTGAYLEFYFDFLGSSVNYKDIGKGTTQGEVEITTILKQGESIINFNKNLVKTPLSAVENKVDFIAQSRIRIIPGTYMLEIILRDVNASVDEDPVSLEQEIIIEAPKENIFISDIQMISGFKKTDVPGPYTKAGYDLIPFVSDYLNPNMNEIVLYAEIYNTAKTLGVNEKFALLFYIEDAMSYEKHPEFGKVLRKDVSEVNPFIQSINIETLYTGSYNFVIEVRDKENNLLAKQKLDFYRNNQKGLSSTEDIADINTVSSTFAGAITDRKELAESIYSLRPISKSKELFIVDNALDMEHSDIATLQGFLFSFWHARSPENAEKAWLTYKEEVAKAENLFGTKNKRGYDTDRGRVFLKYGSPDDITDRPNEQSSYPYQIWRYYNAGNWNNVKFVFYDPMLTLRDYELLNVDYIPGEVRNPRWKLILQSRNTPLNNLEQKEGIQQYGGNIDELYENPR